MSQFTNICGLIITLLLVWTCFFKEGRGVGENDVLAKEKRNWLLYFFVTFFFVLLRVIGLGNIPGGINQDEAMSAVDAFALSQYGTDRFGTFLPAHFTAWDYGQMSTLLAYLTVPFIKLFGFNTTVIRVPMLLASLAGAGAVFYFVKRAFNEKTAFMTFAFLMINPWHYMQSRWAIDCNLFPHMFILGLCFLCLGLKKIKFIYISMIFFALCMYSYGVSFYMVPVFLLAACIYMIYFKKIDFNKCLISGAIYFGLAAPIYITMFINFFHLKTIRLPFVTMQYFENTIRTSDILFFSEKPIEQLRHNILSLLYVGVLQKPDAIWNAIDDFGTIYKCSIPLVILGICITVATIKKGKDEYQKMACGLLLLYWGCSVLTGICINSVNVNRINILFYSHIIFAGIGIGYLAKKWRAAICVVCGIFVIQSTLFFNRYFTIWNEQMKDVFYQDFVEAVDFAGGLACDYYYITPDTQYVGSANVSEILALYTLKVDAKYFQGKTDEFMGREISYTDRFHYENGNYDNLNNWDNIVYIIRSENLVYFHDDAFRSKSFGSYSVVVPIQNATF